MNRFGMMCGAVEAPVRFTLCGFAAVCAVLALSLLRGTTQAVHAGAKGSKEAGAALFDEKGCEHCHGADGRGGDLESYLGPDLRTIGKRWKKPQIEHQIRYGGAGMPAFGDVLQPDEVKDLVDFLHAKRKVRKGNAGAAR